MKKVWAVVAAVVVLAGVGLGGWWLLGRNEASPASEEVGEKFSLSEEMWGQGGFQEITAEEFGDLVAEQKSFVVVLHMMICPAEFPVTSIAKQLAHEEGLVIYGLAEEEFRQTELAQEIKYLPSVALYHDGELVAYLDAESDTELPYYQTVEGLRGWLGRYVEKGEYKMKENVSLEINGQKYGVVLEDNATTKELVARLPLEISMNELNGNEKYYYFEDALPSAPEKVGRVEAGDLMLYGDDCLVLFYESFETAYAYTRVGRVDDVAGLKAMVGKSSVVVKINYAE